MPDHGKTIPRVSSSVSAPILQNAAPPGNDVGQQIAHCLEAQITEHTKMKSRRGQGTHGKGSPATQRADNDNESADGQRDNRVATLKGELREKLVRDEKPIKDLRNADSQTRDCKPVNRSQSSRPLVSHGNSPKYGNAHHASQANNAA